MPDRPGAPDRAWQRMLSGRRLDLLDPSPLDVELSDIAHGLARVARWNGQTSGDHAFSVAQHSLLVEQVFRRLMPEANGAERLAALLHDAPEYVIGDMISPFKAVVGGGYKEVEKRLQRAIHLHFGLPAWFEATQLAGFSEIEAARYFGRPRGFSADDFDLAPRAAKTVERQFLAAARTIEISRGP